MGSARVQRASGRGQCRSVPQGTPDCFWIIQRVNFGLTSNVQLFERRIQGFTILILTRARQGTVCILSRGSEDASADHSGPHEAGPGLPATVPELHPLGWGWAAVQQAMLGNVCLRTLGSCVQRSGEVDPGFTGGPACPAVSLRTPPESRLAQPCCATWASQGGRGYAHAISGEWAAPGTGRCLQYGP